MRYVSWAARAPNATHWNAHTRERDASGSQDQHVRTRHIQSNEKWNYFVLISRYSTAFCFTLFFALLKYPVFISAYRSSGSSSICFLYAMSHSLNHIEIVIYDSKNIFYERINPILYIRCFCWMVSHWFTFDGFSLNSVPSLVFITYFYSSFIMCWMQKVHFFQNELKS